MLRRTFLTLILTFGFVAASERQPLAARVDAVAMTVSDLERSVGFYSTVLQFEKVAEFESAGDPHERLTGVFGMRTRTARLRLGAEYLELTEYLAPVGRPAPADARSDDRCSNM